MKFLASGAKADSRQNDQTNGQKANSSNQDDNKGKSFVFGKNIDSRIVKTLNAPSTSEKHDKQDKEKGDEKDESEKKDNGKEEGDEEEEEETVGFLSATKGPKADFASDSGTSVDKSVFETPENLNVFNVNRLPQPVPSLETGEENEDTFFHATCKLHVFDGQKKSWLERGRGLVKINRDRTTKKFRIVMRQQGIFRLLLNSPIFAAMRLKQVSARAIHVTAADFDTGEMKVYLLTATTPTEALHLFHYLTKLVADLEEEGDKSQKNSHGDEWQAAEATRARKHGRQGGSSSVGNSQEDINTLSSNQEGGRSSSGYLANQSDDSQDCHSDDGCVTGAKRALTELPPKQQDDSNGSSSIGNSNEPLSDVASASDELDDSLSSNNSVEGKNKSNNSESLHLKRPRVVAEPTEES